jgi:hypothetical protein
VETNRPLQDIYLQTDTFIMFLPHQELLQYLELSKWMSSLLQEVVVVEPVVLAPILEVAVELGV